MASDLQAKTAAVPALNLPESHSQSDLHRRGGAGVTKTSPHPENQNPRLDGAISASEPVVRFQNLQTSARQNDANFGIGTLVQFLF
jgi:hypothetical protein